jgi:hypothetical protein
VNTVLRRLPGFAIALVALALSASLTFAGQPVGSSAGLTNASSHAGRAVPTNAAGGDQQGADEDTDTETETDQTDQTDETDTGDAGTADNCTVDLTQDPSVLLTLNHGSVVCSAAHATTWDTTLYPTRGAWVSHWAKMNHGHDPNKGHGHNSGG